MSKSKSSGSTQTVPSASSITLPSGKTLAETIKAVESQIAGMPSSSATTAGSNAAPGNASIGTLQNAVGQPMIKTSPAMQTPATQSSLGAHSATGSGGGDTGQILNKRRLQELVREIDPNEQLDDDVEEVLLQIADDFIENIVTHSCQLAKHRQASSIEVRDVQLHLERNWNMWIPGFGSDDPRPYKKSTTTEAHKQRMALLKKNLKKY
ncbi:PREDICTED: transcription initiation factor TFIID subunit 12-like [Priapulus caudatus]|uniref:Transcription initiation factor TFIID subunit 12 n=1 Tax=Priapulus caudatus TaxID=37621 RepID=A0ABM1EY93_PRICU|nr:PREDICTED: transcription initiation factor TFIID subunit 12-like [Priapulus caudatus]XP_014677165.1 PREDICTED: transcription initiation factor TFIID subunit 12-like [Priapulus caudatus]XP_014677166.1 PREDICTED: transcription initiation factor TFIID subunit 12-like [Priapulus caudatus]